MSGPLPWQRAQWRRLVTAIEEGRLPHALLFAGRQGSGKRLFAEALAARMFCERPSEQGTACRDCRGCRLFLADNHPDLLRLEPPPDKEAIVIDQVRDLIDRVGLTAQQGGYRVLIVDPAERLNPAAANGLLKVLEEPGPGVVFCLVCNRPTALPATVRSRCQRIFFPMPERDEALHWLVRKAVDADEAGRSLEACFDAPLPALRLAQEGGGDGLPDIGADLLALARGERGAVETAGAWLKIDARRSLYGMVACLSALLRQILAPDGTVEGLSGARGRELSRLLPESERTAWHLFGLVDRCFEALRLLETPVNRPLLFEQLAIEWLRVCRPSPDDRPPSQAPAVTGGP